MSKVIAIFGAGPGLGASVARRGFTADPSRPTEAPALTAATRDRFGRIDVIEYGPSSGEQSFSPATRLDAATLEKDSPLLLLTPVEVVRAVLPEWTERGDGAFLMTTGHTAVEPRPYMSGVGPLMSAARNWLYSLNGELAQIGAYAGTLSVAAFIARSEMGEQAAAAMSDTVGPLVDPDDLAAHYWDMYTKRDRVEEIHPRLG